MEICKMMLSARAHEMEYKHMKTEVVEVCGVADCWMVVMGLVRHNTSEGSGTRDGGTTMRRR